MSNKYNLLIILHKMNKIGCFIHSTTLDIWKDEKLIHLLNYIIHSPFIYCLDFIYVNNTGKPLNKKVIELMNPKIKVINYDYDPNVFEIPTIRVMHSFASMNPGYKLLYLHTKGISRPKDCETRPTIISWTNYMLYCIVRQYERCLRLLDIYDTVGCNEMSRHTPENPPHYSGNFWWTTSEYLASLTVSHLKTKWDPEFFIIGSRQDCINYYNIYTLYNMYETEYKEGNYDKCIENRFTRELLYCKLDGFNIVSFMPLLCAVSMGKQFPGHCIIILHDDIVNTDSKLVNKVNEVLNISKMNELLVDWDITIILKSDVTMYITKATWGMCGESTIDITKHVLTNYARKNYFEIPIGTNLNEYLEIDPLHDKRKHLYFEYTINNYSLHSYFDEVMSLYRPYYAKLDFENYTHVEWISSINTPFKHYQLTKMLPFVVNKLAVNRKYQEYITKFQKQFL